MSMRLCVTICTCLIATREKVQILSRISAGLKVQELWAWPSYCICLSRLCRSHVCLLRYSHLKFRGKKCAFDYCQGTKTKDVIATLPQTSKEFWGLVKGNVANSHQGACTMQCYGCNPTRVVYGDGITVLDYHNPKFSVHNANPIVSNRLTGCCWSRTRHRYRTPQTKYGKSFAHVQEEARRIESTLGDDWYMIDFWTPCLSTLIYIYSFHGRHAINTDNKGLRLQHTERMTRLSQ